MQPNKDKGGKNEVSLNKHKPSGNLKFLVWNINGLSDKTGENDVQTLINNNDVIALIETHKGKNYSATVPGYTSWHMARPYQHKNSKKPFGGILILIKDYLKSAIEILPMNNEFIVWLKIKPCTFNRSTPLFIGIVYTPPQGSTYKPSCNFFDCMQYDITEKSSMGSIALVGDFNSRTGRTETDQSIIPSDQAALNNKRLSLDTMVNGYGRKLIEMCQNNSLYIINGRGIFNQSDNNYTCYRHNNGKSVVDYLICSEYFFESVTHFSLLPRNTNSDHVPLNFDIREKPEIKDKKCTYDKPTKLIWDINKKDEYTSSLLSVETSHYYIDMLCSVTDKTSDTNHVTEKFYKLLNNATSGIFKLKTYNPSNTFPRNPWFDNECKILKAEINNKMKLEPNHVEIPSLMRQYKQITQKKKRRYFKDQVQNLTSLSNNNKTDFWRCWRSINHEHKTYSYIDIESFTSYYATNLIESPLTPFFNVDFMDHLEEIILKLDTDSVKLPSVYDDILNAPISKEEIKRAILKAKNNKASGNDSIPAEFYKYADGHLDESLAVLFNHIFDNGSYPDKWCLGMINPIHKQKEKTAPKNYRKITLLPAIGKIFESVLNNRLRYCKQVTRDEDPFQNGFKPGLRTSDNIFMLNGIIEKHKLQKKPLYTCFIDFKSAFDLVKHPALLYKLLNKNIGGKMFKILKDMLNKSRGRVKWDNHLGNIFQNSCGVLQGGVISPMLFNIFLEDLPKYLNSKYGVKMDDIDICHLLQADDLVLISETEFGLKQLLMGLEKFCNRWHIILNLQKTKVMIYNQKYILGRKLRTFQFNGMSIDETNSYTYLGTIFTTESNHFRSNFKNIRNKALRAIGSLRQKLRKNLRQSISFTLLMKLFDSYVMPVLDYGAEVWYQGKAVKDIEFVHLWFLKTTLGIKIQSSNYIVYGDTGRLPLLLRQQDIVLKYWDRLRNFDKSKPLYKVYCELKNLHEEGHHTWYSKALNILEACIENNTNGEMTNHINPADEKTLYLKTKATRYDMYFKQFFENISNSDIHPILRTYRKFKTIPRCEPHLLIPMHEKYRKAISRFRSSSHQLFIETGRHTVPTTPINERICKHCDSSEIDDEMHMMFSCTFHKSEREILFLELPRSYKDLPLNELFIKLLSDNKKEVVINLGKFIYNCFEHRKILEQTNQNM